MRIALAGNPNSGKTTVYNVLTGKNEKVGNWAGVTVDKKVSPIKKSFYAGEEEVLVVDLPGAYSMSPFTSEESVTRDYVKGENPDVIINIVDSTNLSRSLFFTTQLLELGVPVVVALNKSDINEKKKTIIDTKTLSEKLGCPVISTVSTLSSGNGLAEVINTAIALIGSGQKAPYEQATINFDKKDEVVAADKKRYEFVNKIVSEVETRKVLTKDYNINDKIDALLTNKFLGIPIFALVMWAVFYISQSTVGTWIADWLVGYIEMFQEWVAGLVSGAAPILQTILVDGIIGGVGAVVGFLPLVMVMYFLLAFLEDCGYMARVSVVLDPIFKRVGLSGKSVIPLVIGTGCAIPGIMASRTIRDERERRATAMLTPFIPCGAKIPVISLFAGAFFPESKWVSPVMYFSGIVLVFVGALVIKKMNGLKYRKTFFIMELPEYKVPSLKKAVLTMLDRGKGYVVKAGTIILVCNAVVTIMGSYNWVFQEVDAEASILHDIATPFAFLLIPLGFGVWQLAAAAVTGFIAKEEVVGTLAAVYAMSENVINGDFELLDGASAAATLALSDNATLAAVIALAYLMFNLFTPPCFAAIGAMNSEIKSKKWLFGGIALQLGTGYTIAFLVYQIGALIVTKTFGTGFVPGLIAVVAMIAIVVILMIRGDKKVAAEYALKKAAK